MTKKLYFLSVFQIVCILFNQNVNNKFGKEICSTREVQKYCSIAHFFETQVATMYTFFYRVFSWLHGQSLQFVSCTEDIGSLALGSKVSQLFDSLHTV
jgi:hypothetical protein